MPRLVAVQARGCAPIVRAFEQGRHSAEPWVGASTVAFGINVPKALGAGLVLDAVYATGGCAVAVDDREILANQARLARLEGCLICPEGAAAVAALQRLTHTGWLSGAEEIVVVNPGAALVGHPGADSLRARTLRRSGRRAAAARRAAADGAGQGTGHQRALPAWATDQHRMKGQVL